MSMYDEIATRGIKVVFDDEYNEGFKHKFDLIEIDHIKFLVSSDHVRTKGYNAETTLFIAASNYRILRDLFNRTVAFFADNDVHCDVSLPQMTISINYGVKR